jgi:transposase
MGAPYSQDVRDKVFSAVDRGSSNSLIADMFGVSESWVRRLVQRRREHGETAPRPMGGKRFEKIDLVRLADLVAAHPDTTLWELRRDLDVVCAISAIGAAVKTLGLSFTKRRSTPRSRTGPTSPRGVWSGVSGVRGSIRVARSSSTKPGRRPT